MNDGEAGADANGDENGSDGGGQGDADNDAGLDGPSPAKPQGGGLRMWRAARDRAAWKADVLHVRLLYPT